MKLEFGTKAQTLERLSGVLASAQILPQASFDVQGWQADAEGILKQLVDRGFLGAPAIVRSSALAEDRAEQSLAGMFCSIAGVATEEALREAIKTVITSYGRFGEEPQPGDQVIVQPFLDDVEVAGVAFGRDPNTHGPYRVINYDLGGATDSVSGAGDGALKTYVHHKAVKDRPDGYIGKLLDLLDELEGLFGTDWIDIEFAIRRGGQLVLLQARPLGKTPGGAAPLDLHVKTLEQVAQKIDQLNRPHPYLLGRRTILGVMPDWNPAEIIGIRPKPLALSAYRHLVTNSIWAYQRDNYGYRNLRSFPLLLDLHGQPYIDVRVSFNSFIPKDLDEGIADRLVNYYLDRLEAEPHLHDKVEFDILYSCYAFDLDERLQGLSGDGFSEDDQQKLLLSLHGLTRSIMEGVSGHWARDMERIAVLEQRQRDYQGWDTDPVSHIYWLLEDCKRYGTLPFAGLARAGFVAAQMLRSLIAIDFMDKEEYHALLSSIDTVGSGMAKDLQAMNRKEFLIHYGHLRPNTYDLLTPRYDQAPERYLSDLGEAPQEVQPFAFSKKRMTELDRLLVKHDLGLDGKGFLDFIRQSVRGREYGKFVFTRNLSDALEMFKNLGAKHGFNADYCAYANIEIIRSLYMSTDDPKQVIGRSIEAGMQRYALTQQLTLPPLITASDQIWSFTYPASEPNFITQRSVQADLCLNLENPGGLRGKILMLPNADPGYDWIFTHGIAGFITQFGGANSHMAIRALEMDLPAVIGAGEALYNKWSSAQRLEINCANRKVVVIR